MLIALRCGKRKLNDFKDVSKSHQTAKEFLGGTKKSEVEVDLFSTGTTGGAAGGGLSAAMGLARPRGKVTLMMAVVVDDRSKDPHSLPWGEWTVIVAVCREDDLDNSSCAVRCICCELVHVIQVLRWHKTVVFLSMPMCVCLCVCVCVCVCIAI